MAKVIILKVERILKQLITFVTDRLGHDFRHTMNCDKIKHELIWETKNSIKEGLEKTINYYINEEQNNNFFISKNQ